MGHNQKVLGQEFCAISFQEGSQRYDPEDLPQAVRTKELNYG